MRVAKELTDTMFVSYKILKSFPIKSKQKRATVTITRLRTGRIRSKEAVEKFLLGPGARFGTI